MECIKTGKCPGIAVCPYHKWLNHTKSDSTFQIRSPDLLHSMSLVTRHGTETIVQMRKAGAFKRQRVETHSLGLTRLIKFLKLTDCLRTCPWSNKTFSINESIYYRLAACHLHLIVGEAEAKQDRAHLLRFLERYEKLDNARNTIWITNRQQ